jgi:hypothetical protein
MPYVYADVDSLVTTPATANVGTGHCVPLVQQYAKCPVTANWSEGAKVRGSTLAKGTAIATFVNKKYPSASTGNHAALYHSQDKQGVWVVDQYKDSGGIKKRHLRFQGVGPDGKYVNPSNNGDAFSVIE